MQEKKTDQHHKLNVSTTQMKTTYSNAFHSHSTPEELLLSFGVNQMLPSQDGSCVTDMAVQFTHRIIMSHYTAKRLLLSLLQVVREHESLFGEVELDVDKRLISRGSGGKSAAEAQ